AAFIVEYLSQYRGRRTVPGLSRRSTGLYKMLSADHSARSPIPDPSANQLYNNPAEPHLDPYWPSWIELTSRQRLLLAWYVLDQQQAMFFGRADNSKHLDFHLPFPCSTTLWEADSYEQWSTIAAEESAGHTFRVMYVYEAMDDPTVILAAATNACDAFVSALILAYRCSNNKHDPAFYISVGSNLNRVSPAVKPHNRTQLSYHLAMLCQSTPIRELLAVTGETWIVGGRLNTEDQYVQAKVDLRAWASKHNDFTSSMHADYDASIDRAINHSLKILKVALKRPEEPTGLLFEDWAVYLAVLVLWAHLYVNARNRVSETSAFDPQRRA
ncbi:hypothetical protein LTR04_001517, partial [Oleoguttula sp. CCFEE 6159]